MHDNSVAECCWYYSQPRKQYEVQEEEQDEFLGSVKLRQQILGFPPEINYIYTQKLGVSSLFEWQLHCLEKIPEVHKGQHFVYSAPTSAGKTIVSELLMISKVYN